jgi:hypothetical protein
VACVLTLVLSFARYAQAVKDFHDRSLLVKAEHDAMQVRP